MEGVILLPNRPTRGANAVRHPNWLPWHCLHVIAVWLVCSIPTPEAQTVANDRDHASNRIEGDRREPIRSPVSEQQSDLNSLNTLGTLIRRRASTRRLLGCLEEMESQGWLRGAGAGGLPWSTLSPPGWHWETTDPRGRRIVLASSGPLLVAIRFGREVEMSLLDRSDGRSVPRGYAGSPTYFGHRGRSPIHVTGLNERDLAKKSPELYRIFYYFAGPARRFEGLPPNLTR